MSTVEKLNYSTENMDEAMSKELKVRWDKLETLMKERNLDATLIVGNSTVGPSVFGSFRYFTGHKVYFKYQAIVARPGKPVMVCATSVLHQKSLEAKGFTDIRLSPDILGIVLTTLNEQPIKRLGVSLQMMPSNWYNELKKMNIEFVDIEDDISLMRKERSEFEIQAAKTCARIANIGYKAVCASAKPGVRLSDLYAELDYSMKKAGAEETFTLMSCGRFSLEDNQLHCISPYIPPDNRIVNSGDSVAMEITPRYLGYWSQMVRTICVGEQNNDLGAAHGAVVKAIKAIVPDLRPGVKMDDIMVKLGEASEKLGYNSRVPYGHVLSLDLDEGWHYAAESDIILKSGMAVAIHPTLTTPKIEYGIFWGDSYLVTENGGECITSDDSELLTIMGRD